jgi:P-type Cu+ transporter
MFSSLLFRMIFSRNRFPLTRIMLYRKTPMSSPTAGPKRATTFSLGIEGMTCASCVTRVEKAISATPGVASASVNLATQRAEVVLSGAPDITAVVSAIGKAGYGTTVETARFDVDKMSCASCVNHVEKAFENVPGVIEANVNLATKTGTVRFAAGVTNAKALAKAVTSAG